MPRYYVPLTMRGRIALRLGLHHLMTTHIPEPVLARLRAIRGWWFARSIRAANLAEEPSNGA